MAIKKIKKKQTEKRQAKKKPLKPSKRTPQKGVKARTTAIKTPRREAGQKKKVSSKVRKAEAARDRLELLRRQLLQRREEIIKEAKIEIGKYIKGEAKQLVETALDDGDWSVIDLSEDINLKRLETHREGLKNVDEALRKLKDGTYGICEDCGEEISVERLKVLPFALLCRDCQEKKEEMEKVEREEVI